MRLETPGAAATVLAVSACHPPCRRTSPMPCRPPHPYRPPPPAEAGACRPNSTTSHTCHHGLPACTRDYRPGWLEALGDLARYRIVIASMVPVPMCPSRSLTAAAIRRQVPTRGLMVLAMRAPQPPRFAFHDMYIRSSYIVYSCY
jgi:hypothetical protein